MASSARATPRLSGLDAALGGVRGAMATLDRYRTTPGTNAEGGDPGHHASQTLLVRHTVNYLLAALVAADITIDGPLVDVGSGVGVFASWMGRRLGRPVHIVDHDTAVLQLARRSFAEVGTHAALADAPQAAVVTAMEVLEHIRYADQPAFVRSLAGKVRPGGVLVCSTPDERGYLGGWSGYAPHIGTLDAGSVRTLLQHVTGCPVDVWRIDGPGFRMGPLQRIGEPVANRAWAAATSVAPQVVDRLAGTLGRRRRARGAAFEPVPADDEFSVTPATDADVQGTGLLAAVHIPDA